jgi:hypothetical protein
MRLRAPGAGPTIQPLLDRLGMPRGQLRIADNLYMEAEGRLRQLNKLEHRSNFF